MPRKISISLSGHHTSVSLEPEFVHVLTQIAAEKNTSVAAIIRDIDSTRPPQINLSSAVRVWILRCVADASPYSW